jgi:Ser/Thr protein kinase RdoA (MazF antagonist)
VVQYAFTQSQLPRSAEPALTLVGKSYTDDRGQQTFQIMRELNHNLARQADASALAVPQVLFYDPSLRLLAQQRVVGIPYTDLLDRPELTNYVQLAGAALAFLHNQCLAVGREVWLRDHLVDLLYPQPSQLGEQLPQYRAQIETLIAEMESQERAIKPPVEAGPIHRNFGPSKVLYREGRAWVTDWDLFAQGDPALDIANFVVHLQVRLAHQPRRAIAAFIEGYFNARPLLILERVPLYAAFAYLRLAAKCFRRKEARWEDQLRDYLRRGEECLATRSLV